MSGFPNLFLLLGPNTGLGHNSVVFMIECQIAYLLGALRHLDRTGVTAIEPSPRAQREFVAAVDERMRRMVWLRGGCRSWYLDATGRNSTLWPGFTWSYWLRTRRFDPAAHVASNAGAAPERGQVVPGVADQIGVDPTRGGPCRPRRFGRRVRGAGFPGR